MPCNLATTQAAACVSGIGKLTDPVQLLQVIAELSCELAASGGSGSQTPWTQNINAAGFNITNLGTINGVKVYRAMVTQSGTNAPVATVLENTVGNIVWTRLANGVYQGALLGAFVAGKTFCQSSTIVDNSNGYVSLSALSRFDSGNLRMMTSSPVDFTASDDSIDTDGFGFAVEVRVYP